MWGRAISGKGQREPILFLLSHSSYIFFKNPDCHKGGKNSLLFLFTKAKGTWLNPANKAVGRKHHTDRTKSPPAELAWTRTRLFMFTTFDPHDSPWDGTGHTAEMRKQTHRTELGNRPRSHGRVGEHTGFEPQNSDFKVHGLDRKPDAD